MTKNNKHLLIKATSPRTEAGTILTYDDLSQKDKDMIDGWIDMLLKAGYTYDGMKKVFSLAHIKYQELLKQTPMGKKKIYIAGKVTGENYTQCMRKFKATQDTLEGLGFDVVNPMTIVPEGSSWEKAMQTCVAALKECDVLYLLADWKESEGAMHEFCFASQNNIKILFYNQIRELEWVS